MRPRSRAGSVIRLASAVATVAACGQLLNVDGIVIDPQPAPAAAGAAGAGGSPPAACTPGEFRCQGPALELCDADTFRTVRVCSSAELCCADPALCDRGQPGCRAPICSAGEFRCQGDALEQCNPGQTGFLPVDRCAGSLYCNASLGRCTEQPCDAAQREQQCNGRTQVECLPGRSDWSPIDECITHELCTTGARACAPPACRISNPSSQPSPYICTSGNLLRCNDEQTGWEYVETCLNTANCYALIDELVGDPYARNMPTGQLERLGCTPPDCTPGRYRCDGADLLLCNANRTGYLDRMDTCTGPRYCNASAGRCTPEPCSVGDHQCSGDEYQVCTLAGWEGIETCSSGAPCEATSGCQETLCRPNEYLCDGAQLERCNVSRTGWIPVKTCQTSALCDVAAKRCDPPVCEPEARRCTAAGALERCNSGRTGWEQSGDCGALAGLAPGANGSALCDPSGAGRCLSGAACMSGALRCNGAELERCGDNAWHPYAHCSTAAQCDVSSGTCLTPACDPGSFRCVIASNPPVVPDEGASRRGLTLQVCNTSGTGFESVESCAALELCDEAHGQCDICDPTLPPLCSGNRLLVCTADGQEQTLYKVCTEGCIEAGTDGAIRTTCREDLANAFAD
jgi:hypothetical protein